MPIYVYNLPRLHTSVDLIKENVFIKKKKQ